MFHLAAYFISQGALAANVAVTAVGNDQAITFSGGNYILQWDAKLRFAYVLAASVTRARINTPHLRTISLPYINPFQRAAAPPALPNIADFRGNPLDILAIDQIGIEESNDLAMGNENTYAGLWMYPGDMNAAPGPSYTLRGTAALTLTVGTWVAGAITLDQTLPAGTYEVVGMECICNDGVFARLAFPNQVPRPGVVCRPTIAAQAWANMFRFGQAGKFGSFLTYAPPQLEVLGLAAGAETPEVYLDVVKVA